MSTPPDFWARRKAAVRAEQEAETAAQDAEALAQAQAELENRPDEEILAELELPDPDNLKPGDDIVGFMAREVPDRLRRRALRQLWRLNPALANLDGLVDYGEDYRAPGLTGGVVETAYQVGKGMLARFEDEAVAAESPEEQDVPGERPGTRPESDAAPPPEPGGPASTTKVVSADPLPPSHSVDDPPAQPRPRRMRFEFEG